MLEERKMISREKRVNTITAYYGRNETLRDEVNVPEIRQRIRTFSQSSKDEITEALKFLSSVKDTVTIVHGAIGCSAVELGYYYENGEKGIWYSTNLNERDTIMGGDEKLRKTVERAFKKHQPKVIFVVGTPVVAINNDDINSVILELEEELEVKIISVYTDGFKSKASVNGIDIVLHGLVKYIVQKTEEKEDFINLISITENQKSIDEMTRLLETLQLNINVISRFSSIEAIEKAGSAKVSIAINSDEADVFLKGLKEKSGVPYIKSLAPIGTNATAQWLTELGKLLFIEDKVVALIREEEKRVEKYICHHPFNGLKVYVDLRTLQAVSIAGLIGELDGELIGVTVSHIDELNKSKLKEFEKDVVIGVGDGQFFEIANILSKNPADYYISDGGKLSWLSSFPTLPISVENKILYGYEGIIEFTKAIQRAKRGRHFSDYLTENTKTQYKESWLGKSTNWYIKQEVK